MEIPINKDAILERIQNHLESKNRTIALCEQIGINPEWIKQSMNNRYALVQENRQIHFLLPMLIQYAQN